jgi:hypothetical protein
VRFDAERRTVTVGGNVGTEAELAGAVLESLGFGRGAVVAECVLCFARLPVGSGLVCGGAEAHFTCDDCLVRAVAQLRQASLEDLRANGARLCCAGCGAVFGDDAVLRRLRGNGLGAYLAGRERLLKDDAQAAGAEERARLEAEVARLQARVGGEGAVTAAVTEIRERVLAMRCPSCDEGVFYDFEQCFAMTHVGGCGRCFCLWCGELCEGGRAAHAHVRGCARSLVPGSYCGSPPPTSAAGSEANYHASWRERREAAVSAILGRLDGACREAVLAEVGAELAAVGVAARA